MSSSRVRILLVSMLAVFAVSAVASATASAESKDEWDVCEEGAGLGTKYTEHKCTVESGTGKWEWVILKAGETRNVVSRIVPGSSFVLTVGINTITCKTLEDKSKIFGGKPGKDENTILFDHCTTSQAGCKVHSVGKPFGEIEVVNVETELVQIEGTLADLFKEHPTTHEFVTLKFEAEAGKSCSKFPETKVKGQVAGKVVGGKLVFPSPALKVEKSLEAFGTKATLTGEDEQELENGWAVTAI